MWSLLADRQVDDVVEYMLATTARSGLTSRAA
jgi:hypothetical protein